MPRATPLHAIIRLIETCSLAGGAIAAALIAGIAILMLTEIFMRSAIGTPLDFGWEYSAYGMATIFFLGSAYALRGGGHVRVSLLLEALPERAARGVDVACSVVGLAIAVYAAAAAIDLAAVSFARGTTSFTPTKTPLFIPQALVALGLVMLAAQFVARLLRLLLGMTPEAGAAEAVAPSDR